MAGQSARGLSTRRDLVPMLYKAMSELECIPQEDSQVKKRFKNLAVEAVLLGDVLGLRAALRNLKLPPSVWIPGTELGLQAGVGKQVSVWHLFSARLPAP